MVLPSIVFTMIVLLYLGFTCLIGGLCGAVVSRVLRLPWKPIVFLQDMAIAAAAWLLSAIVITEIDMKRLSPAERWDEHISPRVFVFIGLVAPVIRHITRFAFSRARRAGHGAK